MPSGAPVVASILNTLPLLAAVQYRMLPTFAMPTPIDLRRKPRTENVDAVPEVADKQPDASSVIERNEVTDLLESAMQRLPEQQRIAVILSYHENMSNGDIAEVMDTTVSAVESLLKRGRQQLRELLRRHEGDIRGAFTDC